MKLVHYDFSEPVEIKNNFLCLAVENRTLFRKYCADLYAQSQGFDGKFIFTDGEQRLNFGKSGQIIFDLFSLSLKDKKMTSGLYDCLTSVSDQKYQSEFALIVQQICAYLDHMSAECDLPIEYSENYLLSDLLKSAKVNFSENFDSLLEKVISYIQAIQSFTGVKILVFVNIRGYFDDAEFAELLKHIAYSDISVVCLETAQPQCVGDEKILIIDNDMCEILVGSENL